MSKLEIKVLTPRTPYQTYLEERLQSAAGLGWEMPARAPQKAAQQSSGHSAPSGLVAASPLGKPA